MDFVVDREEQHRLRKPVNGGIPKTFHLVWNHSEIPDPYVEARAQLQRLHPGWRIHTWEDVDIDAWCEMEDVGPLSEVVRAIRHAYAAVESGDGDLRQVSDLFRVALIWQQGGVYVDWDFRWQKNIEPLLVDAPCVLTTMHGRARPTVANGFIAAEPHDDFVKFLLNRLVDSYFSKAGDTVQRTGPSFTTRAYRGFFEDNLEAGCRLLDKWVLCPNSYWQKPRAGGYPDSYAVHMWATNHGGVWDGVSENPGTAHIRAAEMLA
jgi:mannosyltransferase OCH1-like enzyme